MMVQTSDIRNLVLKIQNKTDFVFLQTVTYDRLNYGFSIKLWFFLTLAVNMALFEADVRSTIGKAYGAQCERAHIKP